MSARSLAEAVIMQSISDLWRKDAREESINFFEGEGFVKYAAIAGMKFKDKLKVVKLVDTVIKTEIKTEKTPRARRRHHAEIPVRTI